jgi:hypothetical protein
MKITLTYSLAMAASRDAGNRSMRKAGRTRWSRADWNAAAEKFHKLLPHIQPHMVHP